LGLLGWSYKSGEDQHLLLKTYIHKCEPAKWGLAIHPFCHCEPAEGGRGNLMVKNKKLKNEIASLSLAMTEGLSLITMTKE
jgi:hypothetical protein